VERSRAAEALSVMKSIKQAAEIYYLIHGRYTQDFRELDIDITRNGVFDTTQPQQLDTKYFRYYLVDEGDGIYLDAYRMNSSYGYWFDCMFDKSSYRGQLKGGSLYCSARGEKSEKICASFGTYYTSYGADKRYKL
jgi:hypothetical protein